MPATRHRVSSPVNADGPWHHSDGGHGRSPGRRHWGVVLPITPSENDLMGSIGANPIDLGPRALANAADVVRKGAAFGRSWRQDGRTAPASPQRPISSFRRLLATNTAFARKLKSCWSIPHQNASQNESVTLHTLTSANLPRIFSKIFARYLAICGGLRWRIRGPRISRSGHPRRFNRPGRSKGTHLRKSFPRMLRTVRAVGVGAPLWRLSTSPHRSASARLRHSMPGRYHGATPFGPDPCGR